METRSIAELCDIISGGTPKTSMPDYWDGNIGWLSVKDFSGGKKYVYESEKTITKLGVEKSSTNILDKDDIILSARGTVGEMAMIGKPMAFNQSCFGLRTKNSNILNQDFLFYALKNSINSITSVTQGSVFETINRASFERIFISYADINTQKKVATFLSDIDRKIEINTAINRNLSEQCDAIYRERFVTNTDISWTEGHLSDLITVKYGKDHKKLDDGKIPCYGSGGVMRYVEKPLYDQESVLIPRKGTLNNVMYVSEPFWSVDTMFFTMMKIPNVAKFVFHFVKEKDLAAMNAGSAVPSMTTDILNAMELTIPSPESLANFEDTVQPLYKVMKDNEIENKKLAELRDTLLPKLMSDELDVSDLDI